MAEVLPELPAFSTRTTGFNPLMLSMRQL